MAVDGVMFWAKDTPDNVDAFGFDLNTKGDNAYLRLECVSLMETSSRLLLASEFDSRNIGEMSLAQRLIPSAPEHSLPLFDREYYSLG